MRPILLPFFHFFKQFLHTLLGKLLERFYIKLMQVMNFSNRNKT